MATRPHELPRTGGRAGGEGVQNALTGYGRRHYEKPPRRKGARRHQGLAQSRWNRRKRGQAMTRGRSGARQHHAANEGSGRRDVPKGGRRPRKDFPVGGAPSGTYRGLRHGRLLPRGKLCGSPAVTGHRVCRMHGAGGGAPQGNRNAWKHGGYSDQAVSLRRHIAELMRNARHLVETL
jgi:hypothetical protein